MAKKTRRPTTLDQEKTRREQNSSAELCSLSWIKLKEWPSLTLCSSSVLRVVDLFCGCGGLTLGAAEAARIAGRKLEIALAVDTSAPALQVYRANFGVDESVAIGTDIRELVAGDPETPISATEYELARKVGSIDLLMAGPPCQGHSDLNNNSRRNDERNKLYLTAARFAQLIKPRVILMENVPTVVHDEHRVVERARTHLLSMGYQITEIVIQFLDLGIPQKRRRHLLIASLDKSLDFLETLFTRSTEAASISSFIADIQDEPDLFTDIFRTPSRMSPTNRRRAQYMLDHGQFDLPNRLRPTCHRNGRHSYKSMYGRLSWEKPAQTITTGFGSMGQGRYIHPSCARVLTPHEATRIQGLPDFFSFTTVRYRTHLQEMIGNAVPPQLSARLVSELISRKAL